MAEFYVSGSGGYLVCCTSTGKVLDVYLSCKTEDTNYNQIDRVDTTGYWFKEGDNFDILDVGYWMKDGTYEPKIEEAV